MNIDIEVDELLRLERGLREDIAAGVAKGIGPVVDRAALNVKRDWVAGATRSAGTHGRHYPRAIDYDSGPHPAGHEARVGPRTDRPQGHMGPGFEYGSANQPPHLDGETAMLREAPRFEGAVADLIWDRLR